MTSSVSLRPVRTRSLLTATICLWVAGCSGPSSPPLPIPATRPTAAPRPSAAETPPSAPGVPRADPTAAHAGTAAAPRRFDLLHGRLRAWLPAGGAELEDPTRPTQPAGVNIRESRHVVDDGAFHAAIATFELMPDSGADFEGEVRAAVARWEHPPPTFRLEALSARSPLRVVQVTLPSPERVELREDAGPLSLITVLYVAHPDGTAQSIELHTNGLASGGAGGARHVPCLRGPTRWRGRGRARRRTMLVLPGRQRRACGRAPARPRRAFQAALPGARGPGPRAGVTLR